MSGHQENFQVLYSNSTLKFDDTTEFLPSSTVARKIFFVLFPCMVFTGVICNSLVFVIMRRQRMSHLSTCYYMGILAVADTSVLILGLTVMWLYLLNRQWSLLLQSTYGCKVLSLLFYTVSDVSVWLVCLMSTDRCIAVIRPLHASSICTVGRARICVIVLVLCILLINIQFLFTHHLSTNNDCTHHERYEHFIHRIWPWIDAAVYSVLPFILLLTINSVIVHSLFHARHSTSTLQIHHSQRMTNIKKQSTTISRKLTTMLLSVTFFFLLSSFPMVCLQIYTNISTTNQMFAQLYLKPLCETLQYSNHCINFFLYAISGKAFRHELKRLFTSIAIKMHLIKIKKQKRSNCRTLAANINCLTIEKDLDQRYKSIRPIPLAFRLMQSRQSIDSTGSYPCLVDRTHLNKQRGLHRQSIIRGPINDPSSYIQRISIV